MPVTNRPAGTRRKPAVSVLTVRPPGRNRAATSSWIVRRSSCRVAQTSVARPYRRWNSRPTPSRPARRPSVYAVQSPASAPAHAAASSGTGSAAPVATSAPAPISTASDGTSGSTASTATARPITRYAQPASTGRSANGMHQASARGVRRHIRRPPQPPWGKPPVLPWGRPGAGRGAAHRPGGPAALRLVDDVHRGLLGGRGAAGDAFVVRAHVLLLVRVCPLVRFDQPPRPRVLRLELRRREVGVAPLGPQRLRDLRVLAVALGGEPGVVRLVDLLDRVAQLLLEDVRLLLDQPPVERLAVAHLAQRGAVVGLLGLAVRRDPARVVDRRLGVVGEVVLVDRVQPVRLVQGRLLLGVQHRVLRVRRALVVVARIDAHDPLPSITAGARRWTSSTRNGVPCWQVVETPVSTTPSTRTGTPLGTLAPRSR